jgi:hypothetical protein
LSGAIKRWQSRQNRQRADREEPSTPTLVASQTSPRPALATPEGDARTTLVAPDADGREAAQPN